MIQYKPTCWNTIFVSKGVMMCYIVWLSNEQPIVFPQLMHIIPTASWTYSWKMISAHQILILNFENTVNNYCNISSGLLMLSSICNHCMYSIISFGQNYILLWRPIYFFFEVNISLYSNPFLYAGVFRLSFHS